MQSVYKWMNGFKKSKNYEITSIWANLVLNILIFIIRFEAFNKDN